MKTELKKLVADKLLGGLSEEGINGKERMKVLSCAYGICRTERNDKAKAKEQPKEEAKNESESQPAI